MSIIHECYKLPGSDGMLHLVKALDLTEAVDTAIQREKDQGIYDPVAWDWIESPWDDRYDK